MKSSRFATFIAVAALAAAAPAQALAAGGSSSPITSTAPSRLHTGTTTTAGTLPNTGLNLMPETVAGLALLGAGLGLRARRARA